MGEGLREKCRCYGIGLRVGYGKGITGTGYGEATGRELQGQVTGQGFGRLREGNYRDRLRGGRGSREREGNGRGTGIIGYG
jgi:hypothetical protein